MKRRRDRLVRTIYRKGVLEGAVIEIDADPSDPDDPNAKPQIVVGAEKKDLDPWRPLRPATSEERPCSVCLVLCWVTATSREYMAKGIPLMCLTCARRAADKKPRN